MKSKVLLLVLAAVDLPLSAHSLGINATYAMTLFDDLVGPKTYQAYVSIATSIITFRSASFFAGRDIYRKSEASQVDLERYFEDDRFLRIQLATWRDLFFLIFGRFVVDLLVYGPQRTFEEGFGTLSLREMLEVPLKERTAGQFASRFAMEGPGITSGFLALQTLGRILDVND